MLWVITTLVSGTHRHFDYQGSVQSVAGCVFDSTAAYLTNSRFVQIHWSSGSPSDYWFVYTFADGQVLGLFSIEVMSHMGTLSDKLGTPQILPACVFN